MQIGFNLLVVGGAISPADRPVLESLKRHGYDGVEVPVMAGTEADCAALGRVLDELGLARTYTTIIPDPDHSPMSADPGVRRRARDRLAWAIDCGHALGATVMGGPYHSPLGVFSGDPGRPRTSWPTWPRRCTGPPAGRRRRGSICRSRR